MMLCNTLVWPTRPDYQGKHDNFQSLKLVGVPTREPVFASPNLF